MTDYDPVDDRPLDLDWQDTDREGQVWVSGPIATTDLIDGEAQIRLAIKSDGEEFVFWAEQWVEDAPHESISNTTYASESVDGMVSALGVIRDTVEQTFDEGE